MRWTLKQASEEFGVNIQALTRKLKSNGALHGPDKMYSTRQVFESLTMDFDLKKAQLALVREQGRLASARSSIMEKEFVPVAIVEKVWSDFMVDLRQKISNLSVPAKERSEILADLQTIPVENYFVNLEKATDKEEELE